MSGAGRSKGEEGSAGPAGFSSWVSRELGRAEALLKVVGSRPDTLADNFFTLMPSGTLPDYQRIIDLKVSHRQLHDTGLKLLALITFSYICTSRLQYLCSMLVGDC